VSATLMIEPFLVALDPAAERVRALCEPVIESEGCELVQIQVVRAPKTTRVRFFVDTKSADTKVELGDLEKLNRLLGDLLDVEDEHEGLFKGQWDLEVGSPGVDRPLTKKTHFEAAHGERIKIKTNRALQGHGRTLTGVLAEVGADGFDLKLDDEDEPLEVGFNDLADAHVVFQFEAPKKPKAKRSKKNKKK